MFSKLKTSLVLTVIGLVSGLSIWGINELTAPIIEENQAAEQLGIFIDLFPEGVSVDHEPLDEGTINQITTVYDADETAIGTVLRGTASGYGGIMTVLVGVDTRGEIVDVIIGDNFETANIVGGLIEDYLPNLRSQPISDVSYDAETGATLSYNAVQTVVNASRNLVAGDPLIELINDLDLDADGYEETLALVPAEKAYTLLNGASPVGTVLELKLPSGTLQVLFDGTTVLGAGGDADVSIIDALNARAGEAISGLVLDDFEVQTKIIRALEDSAATDDLAGEFIFATRPYVVDGETLGTTYLGTSEGFRDDNTFAISFLENGELAIIESLFLSDTPAYYADYVEPGFAGLYGRRDFSEVFAQDVFAGASTTGASLTDILKEAVTLAGGQ